MPIILLSPWKKEWSWAKWELNKKSYWWDLQQIIIGLKNNINVLNRRVIMIDIFIYIYMILNYYNIDSLLFCWGFNIKYIKMYELYIIY